MMQKALYMALVLLTGGLLLRVTSSWATAQTTAPSGSIMFMIFGEPAEKAAYDKLVAAFSARHPQVEVRILYIPNQNSYRTRLAADLAAGTPADVFLLNYRRYAQFAARGVLEPLDAYVAQSKVLKLADFYPEAVEPFRWNRRLMGIPQNLSSLVVY